MKLLPAALVFALAVAALRAAPARAQVDSQLVVARYVATLAKLPQPKNMVFSYSVSQAGPVQLEQLHVIYRSGKRERDETLSVDGKPLKPPSVRIFARTDRYAVQRIAPTPPNYVFLFTGAARSKKRTVYSYDTTPLHSSAFAVTGVSIDSATFLPTQIQFVAKTPRITARGAISYAKIGRYCVPTVVTVTAHVKATVARERIAWGGYRFPVSLPPSTFSLPKPLPSPSPSPF